jgi:hypothetical protein
MTYRSLYLVFEMFRLNFHRRYRFHETFARRVHPPRVHSINFVFFDDRNDFENFIEFLAFAVPAMTLLKS